MTLRPSVDDRIAKIYFRHLHSQIRDMITSVYAVNTAIDFLRERQIDFVMTYMDNLILEPIDPNWHDPRYISVMQNKIKNFMIDFVGINFLDWSPHIRQQPTTCCLGSMPFCVEPHNFAVSFGLLIDLAIIM